MGLFTVILAGGSGTRFWPASRRARPKQLLSILPGSEQSLIEATVRRIGPLCPPARILVSTGAHLLESTRRVLPELPASSFLAEPVARNTAPCIGWASLVAKRHDPHAVLMVLPSDQHIGDEAAFRAALQRAVASASSGTITTIGITPTRPETGYGYLESGAELGGGVCRVERFVEKPDQARAEEYVASGRYFWNSGMFFFQASVMLDAIAQHLPDLHAGLMRIEQAAEQGPSAEQQEVARVFESTASISIDYGVMERVSPLNLVPASFGWSDLGSWQTAWELAARDRQDNAVDPGALAIAARGNLIKNLRTDAAERIIAIVGADNLCVVDTDDALLIIPRDRAQDVRLVVEALRERRADEKL